ncbi:diguanylate cyclase [Amaricoccus sp.]|uniref:GGDEF domain-containing protein n=1 Tax=Amaricoccus sp. TaxID=1872485 RepID=UPI00261787CB|nr:sensor domain-containing diguanylate cyclase [Amaricoccus sp.]HRO10448.1 sensor domain-containing diguanylate cyclase [Amaricoccus sp.]
MSLRGIGAVALDATAEFERLNALRRYAILDTPADGAFDRITQLAAEMLEVPVAVVSLVDTSRIWYKSVHGPFPLREIGRLPGLCAAAIGHDGAYVVESARGDPRTQEHPLVAGAFGLEFYAGVPLRTYDGHVLGMLCCMDTRPRGATPQQLRFLETLAAIVMDEIELRRSARQISRLSEALADACTDLERRASFDPLTGVLARTAMLERSEALVARALAGGRGAALLMLDIDRFKAINDTHGHAAGDRVLREVAGRMAASCRAGDLLGRIGGEEFLAVFAEVAAADAGVIADRLREAVARTPVAIESGARLTVTVSGGLLGLAPADAGVSFSAALSRADAALYAAKLGGRNRIVEAE